MTLSKRDTERLYEMLTKVRRFLQDDRHVIGTFDRGGDWEPNGSQWVPAHPDRYTSRALGAHQPPEGYGHRLSIFKADAIGSDMQLVFRCLEILEGTYQPHITEAR